ncbi:MAG: ArsR family transcriptional regulator [Methanomicrobiales archaeon]|nr:ArsR family transcriptional regulator [Methanomicrobiales archaeon]
MKAEMDISAQSGSSPTIGLFATERGIRTVESPVRVEILSVLRGRELSFQEIVKATQKAKSTISSHLGALLKEGIIGEKPDLADSRRKFFYIRSRFLGEISPDITCNDDGSGQMVAAFLEGNDPSTFYKLMLRTIRVSLMSKGINIDPILREAGFRMGLGLYAAIASPDLSTLIVKTANFWKEHHLGQIVVENYSPVTLIVYDCFECDDLPHLGRPACAFDAGVLEAIFSQHFGVDHMTTELRCYAMGDDHCKFVIRPVGDPK